MIEVTGGPEGRGGSGLINYDGKSRSSVRCWTMSVRQARDRDT